jgi:hypothetical protein
MSVMNTTTGSENTVDSTSEIRHTPASHTELVRIEKQALSDASVVFDVVGIEDRVFCRDEKSAIYLVGEINAAIAKVEWK